MFGVKLPDINSFR